MLAARADSRGRRADSAGRWRGRRLGSACRRWCRRSRRHLWQNAFDRRPWQRLTTAASALAFGVPAFDDEDRLDAEHVDEGDEREPDSSLDVVAASELEGEERRHCAAADLGEADLLRISEDALSCRLDRKSTRL